MVTTKVTAANSGMATGREKHDSAYPSLVRPSLADRGAHRGRASRASRVSGISISCDGACKSGARRMRRGGYATDRQTTGFLRDAGPQKCRKFARSIALRSPASRKPRVTIRGHPSNACVRPMDGSTAARHGISRSRLSLDVIPRHLPRPIFFELRRDGFDRLLFIHEFRLVSNHYVLAIRCAGKRGGISRRQHLA